MNTELTSTHFDLLPAELHVNILKYCSYHDLLNLRRTSHAFKNLIDVNESNIAREMVDIRNFGKLAKLFVPPKQRTGSDQSQVQTVYSLKYIHFLRTAHKLCQSLAYHLAERAVNPAMDSFLRKEKRDFASTSIRSIQATLTPQLYRDPIIYCLYLADICNSYHVYHFIYFTHLRLESARATLAINYTSHLLLSEPSTLLMKYLDIQQEIISSISDTDLITIHHCMTFLVNTMRLSLSPEPPHNQNDALVCSLLRSHIAMNRILEYFLADSATTRNGGRNLRKNFMEKMQREKEESEMRSPINFGGQEYQPKVKETWFAIAKGEMEKRGLGGHQPEIYTFKGIPSVRFGCQMCRDG